jgi:hypothetical protein
MIAALKPYRIVELPRRRRPKRKSQFIDQADRGLAISKSSHNLDGMTACFMRCDKKRATVLPRCIFVAESALSKFIRIFRAYDAHRINALIDCRNSRVECGIATDWHKLHITPARSRTTLWTVVLAMRVSGLLARGKEFLR